MVVMQRIHVDDLVGYLLENEAGFEVLNLPAVAQSTTTYDLGGGRTHTREKGDLLHPADEPAEALPRIKKSMGPMLFSTQYQQAPEPPGGKIIKKKMLQYYSAVERRSTDRIVLGFLLTRRANIENYQFRTADMKDSDPVRVPARSISHTRPSLGI
jgi:hypothetical protein